MTKTRVLVATLAAAVLAVLFPPWGYRGEIFDSFAFPFSRIVVVKSVTGNMLASIVWHLLALELVVIGLIGAIAYVLVRRR